MVSTLVNTLTLIRASAETIPQAVVLKSEIIVPDTPGVSIPSAMTAQVPQMTMTKIVRFRKLLPSRSFLNLLLEVSESEYRESPMPRLRLDRD